MASGKSGICELCLEDKNLTTVYERKVCCTCAFTVRDAKLRPELVIKEVQRLWGDKYFPQAESTCSLAIAEEITKRDKVIHDLTQEIAARCEQLDALLAEKNSLQERLESADAVLDDLRNVLECKENESAPQAAYRLIMEVQARTAAGYEERLAQANAIIKSQLEKITSMQPLQISGTMSLSVPTENVYFEAAPEYAELCRVLSLSVDQAANGKGKERHAKDGEPFEKQKICEITRRVGIAFPLGQAIKKAEESLRLSLFAGRQEILGAINYLAAGYIVMEEMDKDVPF